jgi:predicted ArsR family transcriptional regulator
MTEEQDTQVAAVAALDEPTRRRLYDHVVRQPEPVSRDDAAAAVRLPRSTAAFHLDRLVDEGLLDVAYERRTGRTGPGAGRPAKLYRRGEREVAVILPGRRYDLAGELLAAAVEDAETSDVSPRRALERRAHAAGRQIAAEARDAVAGEPAGDRPGLVVHALEQHGYEPRAEPAGSDRIVLVNCPFHALAAEHRTLVCGMNLHLLDGMLDELGGQDSGDLRACLDPAPGRCCVVLAPDAEPA